MSGHLKSASVSFDPAVLGSSRMLRYLGGNIETSGIRSRRFSNCR